MRRSSLNWLAFVMLSLGAVGCTDEGVGDPCVPEAIPCDQNGENCGYKASESYLETSSVQCRSRLCIVRKLDNGSAGQYPSDPRNLCDKNSDPGCLSEERLENSVYCTCRCGVPNGVKTGSQSLCSCPDGFECREVLTQGGPGVIGSYCVKGVTEND
jgi:hypothetical protein